MMSARRTAPPQEWGSTQAAKRAANLEDTTGRWVGDLLLTFVVAEPDRFAELGAPHRVPHKSVKLKRPPRTVTLPWDSFGMFASEQGQVPSRRAWDWTQSGLLLAEEDDLEALDSLALYSSPSVSPWASKNEAVPFLRSFCRMPAALGERLLCSPMRSPMRCRAAACFALLC